MRQVRVFFGAYFIAITFLLIWNLAHCAELEWTYRDLFLADQENGQDLLNADREDGETKSFVRILDGEALTMETGSPESNGTGKKARFRGIMILRYENEGELRFYDESLRAEVFSGSSGEALGSASLALRMQTPYPQDETKIYIPFREALEGTAEEPLRVRVTSEGLYRNGLTIFTARDADSGMFLVGRACYEKKTFRFLGPVVFFLFEGALGFFCLLLCVKKRIPVFPDFGEITSGSAAGKKRFTVFAVVLAAFAVLAGYAYRTAVVPAANACGAEYLVSGAIQRDSLQLGQGDAVRQAIMPRQDRLAGIGIRIRGKGDGKTDVKAFRDAQLSWRILDEEGTSLAGGAGRVGDLKEVSDVLLESTAEKELRNASSSYLFLPLDEAVEQAAGRQLFLELCVEDAGTSGADAVPLQTSTGGNGRASVGTKQWEEELCLLGVYQNNGFLKGYFLLAALAVFALAVLLYFMIFFLRPGLPVLVFVCVLSLGFVYSFVTPAYTVPDERTHIETVYAMSNRFLGITDPGGPDRLMKRACDVDAQVLNTMPLSVDSYRRQADVFGTAQEEGAFGQGTELVSVFARNALSNAVPLCYLPSTVGFTAARLLGRNLITMVLAARWCNLLACALLLSLAAGRMPFGGISMALVGLFPRALQLMASCSYDGMVMTGIFVFAAWCYHLMEEDGICAVDILIFVFSGIYTALCKGGAYLPVTGIVLLIPLMRKGAGDRTRAGLWKAALAMLGAAGFLFLVKHASTIFAIFSRASGEVTYWTGEETLYTFSDLLADPARFLKIVLNTFYIRADSMVGEMTGHILFRRWWIVYGLLGLLLLGLVPKKGDKRHFPLSVKLTALFFAASSSSLIWLSMLLSFTSTDATYIGGLQGRYFLPLLPLVFPALENRIVLRDRLEDGQILYAACLLSAAAVFYIFLGCFSLL